MSEKRTKMRQRSLAFRRRLRGEKKNRAVSPVVATLILILIAVAAAAALYLWLVAWQGGVTKGIGSPGAQYTVTIGGSTSVYPFAELAATQFEQNNSDVVISVNQGGSGAGAAAVCSGQVDIGEVSSFAYPLSYLTANDGCPGTAVEQVIAYDGVDLILDSHNTLGLYNMSWDTAQAIWTSQSNTPAGSGGTTSTNIYALGNLHMNGIVAPVQATGGAGYNWDQIPACSGSTTPATSGTTVSCAGQPAETNTPAISQTVSAATPLVKSATVNSIFIGTCTAGGTIYSFGNDTLAVTGFTSSGAIVDPTLATPTIACSGALGGYTTVTLLHAVSYASGTVTVAWEESDTVAAGSGTFVSVSTTETTAGTLAGIVQNVPTNPLTATASTGSACTGFANDLCATLTAGSGLNGAGTGVSTCGFEVCVGTNHAINLYYRSDVSGTTTGFLARVLAVAASGGVPSGLSYTGCGGDNVFDGCGLAFTASNTHGASGNPAVIAGVAGDLYGLGYASDGLAQAPTSNVVPINFQGYGQSVVVNLQGESTALKAIAKGISDTYTDSATFATDQAYVGWRPFVNIETSTPTGEVYRYLEFVMDPFNNQALAAESAEISVYASGLAGVVPITPVSGSQTLP